MQVRRVVAAAGLLVVSAAFSGCDSRHDDTCTSFLQVNPLRAKPGEGVSLHRDPGCDAKSGQQQVRVVVIDSEGRRRPAGSVDLSVTGKVTGRVTIPQDLARGEARVVLQENVPYECDDTSSCVGTATSTYVRLE